MYAHVTGADMLPAARFGPGDTAYGASVSRVSNYVLCPLCAGEKRVIIKPPSYSDTKAGLVACSCCGGERPGMVLEPSACLLMSVDSITIERVQAVLGLDGITYEYHTNVHGSSYDRLDDRVLFATAEEARIHGQRMKAAEQDASRIDLDAWRQRLLKDVSRLRKRIRDLERELKATKELLEGSDEAKQERV